MQKVILALALFTVSAIANAVSVSLTLHRQTSGSGTISTLFTDGSHISGDYDTTTATFDWDGTTLTSTGVFGTGSSIGSSPFATTVLGDTITDLAIDTSGGGDASATAYTCIEGDFLTSVNVTGCGGYNFGTNSMDESTVVWGPGTATARTIGGDDEATGTVRSISAYDFGSWTFDGTTLTIGNGVAVGSVTGGVGGEELVFTTTVIPVPAAVWLFGSALGLLGWVRHRATK